ncbi:hypothetical protein NDU88_009377 [Pleurodeles waltl]|uniref:Uncharacterized protein n=1 Tax=Pleurodeles waltl TaxID=8319 RepID=A0AAV7RV19_PLEWA|nr:hypothetical protein NDU88_009377 [Pleurodeles waltl]
MEPLAALSSAINCRFKHRFHSTSLEAEGWNQLTSQLLQQLLDSSWTARWQGRDQRDTRRNLDVNSTIIVQSLVTELVDPPGIRTVGSWRRLLADRDKADLGTKAQRKWACQEGLEVSSDCWETINCLNFSVLRGANWHQMIFFRKWILYRTPQALSRMGTGYPDMCFRCKEVGVAGWDSCDCDMPMYTGILGWNFCDVNNHGAVFHISQHSVNELGLRS